MRRSRWPRPLTAPRGGASKRRASAREWRAIALQESPGRIVLRMGEDRTRVTAFDDRAVGQYQDGRGVISDEVVVMRGHDQSST